MMWGYYGAWGWLGPLMMLLFWILVIGGVVLILRAWWPRLAGPRPGDESALEILRKRYARGEISREEFDEMRRDLEGNASR